MTRFIIAKATVEQPELSSEEYQRRMFEIFAAASGSVAEFGMTMAASYAGAGIAVVDAVAAVGKALVTNGVGAIASSVGVESAEDVGDLINVVNDLIACRLEEITGVVAE